MKLVMFIVFENVRGFLLNILPFFAKKKQFWTFWELVSIITIWDAFQSFFWIFAFLKKLQRFFRKKPNAKRCENSWAKTQFETDCTSNLANYSFLTENSSFLIRKTPLLFPRKSKVWKFWEIWAKIPFETHSIKILLISAIFKNDQQFFEITHLRSRKSQAVERFPFSRAIVLFEKHSNEKYLCLAFLKNFKCFCGKNISFSKNPTFWTSSEHMSISELRDAFEKNLGN